MVFPCNDVMIVIRNVSLLYIEPQTRNRMIDRTIYAIKLLNERGLSMIPTFLPYLKSNVQFWKKEKKTYKKLN